MAQVTTLAAIYLRKGTIDSKMGVAEREYGIYTKTTGEQDSKIQLETTPGVDPTVDNKTAIIESLKVLAKMETLFVFESLSNYLDIVADLGNLFAGKEVILSSCTRTWPQRYTSALVNCNELLPSNDSALRHVERIMCLYDALRAAEY